MPKSAREDQFSPKETKRRFEALMRGAFSGSPQPMKDIPRKRPKATRKAKAKKSSS